MTKERADQLTQDFNQIHSGRYSALGAQQSANASQANYSNSYQRFCQTGQMPWELPVVMTAADLGIVDQLLDDKIGMEP